MLYYIPDNYATCAGSEIQVGRVSLVSVGRLQGPHAPSPGTGCDGSKPMS